MSLLLHDAAPGNGSLCYVNVGFVSRAAVFITSENAVPISEPFDHCDYSPCSDITKLPSRMITE
jgi:hypothetical protein